MSDDPLISGSADEAKNYKSEVMAQVRNLVNSDRRDRAQTSRTESQPVIQGVTGFGDGLKSIPR
jgi:hypothetical protein